MVLMYIKRNINLSLHTNIHTHIDKIIYSVKKCAKVVSILLQQRNIGYCCEWKLNNCAAWLQCEDCLSVAV